VIRKGEKEKLGVEANAFAVEGNDMSISNKEFELMLEVIMSNTEMSNREVHAQLAGNVSLGGELSVHRLGFGAMRLTGEGIWGPPKDRKRALAVLRRAVELGVNFIDTADSYGPYVSEELIAEALFPYPKDLVIATKGGWNRPGPDQWTHDASPAHLRKAIEGSLKRLRLDRIDLYQLHTPDPAVSFDVSVETLAQLRHEGKIRLVGLSNVTQEHIERAHRIVPIVSVQNRYSFADREWDYVANYCQRNGIVFIPWYPLAAGAVAGEALHRIAQAHGASPTQIALAWLLQRSPLMLPIPGTSSIEHLEQNVAAASLLLTGEEYEELSRVGELKGSQENTADECELFVISQEPRNSR
jgi:pyridoxine 4-dehydrogenase